MAAPVYLQTQISAMLSMRKFVKHDEWQRRYEGRPGNDEQRNRFRAYPVDESDLTEFVIETCKCVARGEASFTLFGKLIGYPEQPLCRYEIQICRHRNPKWFSPAAIGVRVLHKHVYNERAIREGWPWDKCAEPLAQGTQPRKKLSLQQAIDRIGPIFLSESNIEIHDPDSMDLFFRGRQS